MGPIKRVRASTLAVAAGCLLLGLALGSCGLGRNNNSGSTGAIHDPVVAATVNGRPIYIEDVRSRAVELGRLHEGEDLNANSDAFYLTLEELIQVRLFSMEAEARGLDRDADVRRKLEGAREQVLADAIYDEIDTHANNPDSIARLYRENMNGLNQGQEVHLRHIQFDSMESAAAAKRRLDRGERFEELAYTLSLDTQTGADGGDLGFRSAGDLIPSLRQAVASASVGQIIGPIQIGDSWHLLRVDDIRQRGAPSIETLRPRIIDWLRFQEISQLEERLERNAKIERLRQPEPGAPPAGDVTVPADSPSAAATPPRPTPDLQAPQTGGAQTAPPPFPFPTGPASTAPSNTQTAPPPTPRPSTTTTTTRPAPAVTTSTTTRPASTATTTAPRPATTTTTTTPRPPAALTTSTTAAQPTQ